ncbi:hypothetical protein ON010_g18560 [Phytophthora cinnamomi]|nr:hypothetical protein ON010_g18560 [Phytophthora cinnamomi]
MSSAHVEGNYYKQTQSNAHSTATSSAAKSTTQHSAKPARAPSMRFSFAITISCSCSLQVRPTRHENTVDAQLNVGFGHEITSTGSRAVADLNQRETLKSDQGSFISTFSGAASIGTSAASCTPPGGYIAMVLMEDLDPKDGTVVRSTISMIAIEDMVVPTNTKPIFGMKRETAVPTVYAEKECIAAASINRWWRALVVRGCLLHNALDVNDDDTWLLRHVLEDADPDIHVQPRRPSELSLDQPSAVIRCAGSLHHPDTLPPLKEAPLESATPHTETDSSAAPAGPVVDGDASRCDGHAQCRAPARPRMELASLHGCGQRAVERDHVAPTASSWQQSRMLGPNPAATRRTSTPYTRRNPSKPSDEWL